MAEETTDTEIDPRLLRLRVELFTALQTLKGEDLKYFNELVRDIGQCVELEGATNQWKPGDVVRLKTGGWPMTIERLANGEAQCVWFEKHQQISSIALTAATDKPMVTWVGPKRERFLENALEKCEPLS